LARETRERTRKGSESSLQAVPLFASFRVRTWGALLDIVPFVRGHNRADSWELIVDEEPTKIHGTLKIGGKIKMSDSHAYRR
jgi:hypothetical protein